MTCLHFKLCVHFKHFTIFSLSPTFIFICFSAGSNRLSAPPEMNQGVKIVDESHQWSDAGMEVRKSTGLMKYYVDIQFDDFDFNTAPLSVAVVSLSYL